MINRIKRTLTLRRFAVLAVLLLGFAVVTQPLTTMMARVSPRLAQAVALPVLNGNADARSDKGSQQRPETIQTAFTNATTINIPATPSALPNQPAAPYPSNITVSGLTGSISALTVRLNGIHHTQFKDVEVLLVGPTGAKFIVMSDIGGAGANTPPINLTFDDAAAANAPGVSFPLVDTTFKPTDQNIGGVDVSFPAPAPAAPYSLPAPTGAATFTSVFGGTAPNGVWSLYILDDIGGDSGACDGGWTIDVTTSTVAAPTTTTIQSSLNPSLTTQTVSFTANVTETTGGAPVTLGNVTFVDNSTGTILAANVPLNGSGNASTGLVSFTERRHLITATYNPDATHLGSNASLTQIVDFPTTNPSPGMYCNTNSITVPDPAGGTAGTAVQYPSRINVTGMGGRITHLTVSIKNVTHTAAQDLDLLLVGPGGQNIILVSDTGGATSNVSVDFDDNAATQLAAAGAWGAPASTVQSRPVERGVGVDTLPAPAPAAPYGTPAPAGTATLASIFNNTPANGIWSLYIFDDAGGDAGTIAGGWCLTFTTSNGAPVDFDGDGDSDYAIVRDSGLPRMSGQIMPTAGVGGIDELEVPPGRAEPLAGRGRFFRLPGERFDPLEPRLEGPEGGGNQLRWLINTSGPTADINILFGNTSEFPVPVDYDGDGRCDIAVWSGGVGAQFRVLTSSSGFVTVVTYTLGNAQSDPSVVGDYDGDGRADPAVFNSTTGQWSYLGGPTHAVLTTVTPVGAFGGGFPIPGDYNGDFMNDFMVETRNAMNQTQGHFFLWHNNGTTTPPATTNFVFGNYRDVVIPGDYNGDTMTDIGLASIIVNPIQWRVRLTGSGTMLGPFNLGNPVIDYTLGGDYNGNGSADMTIWHSPGQFQSLLAPAFTPPTLDFSWGQSGDYPVAYFNSH